MPAPINRVFCLCFRAIEICNNKQWDSSRPECGISKSSSGERDIYIFVAVYRNCSEEAKAYYSLDNLHHLKLGITTTHLHFITLANSERRQGELDFIITSPTSVHFATGIFPPHLPVAALWSHYQVLIAQNIPKQPSGPSYSVMPGQPWMKGLPSRQHHVKWGSSQQFHSWNLSRGIRTRLRPQGQLYLLVGWSREGGWL